MNKRITALISTISNSFNDFTLDIAINRYNMYSMLLGTSIGSFLLQLIYGLIIGINFTFNSLIIIAIYGLSMLLGYIFYVLSLKRIPIALTALIESGNLFAYLLIDYLCGYFKINIWFCFLFILHHFIFYRYI